MALINCPDCGKEVSDSAPSCIHCGCVLKVNTIRCPECGAENSENTKTCAKCGFAFKTENTAQQVIVINKKSTSKKLRDIGLILAFASHIILWIAHIFVGMEDASTDILAMTATERTLYDIAYYVTRSLASAFALLLVAIPKLRKKSMILVSVLLDLMSTIAFLADGGNCIMVLVWGMFLAAQLLKFISLIVKDEE